MVIDDEADYATPNAKINMNEKTKINDLVSEHSSEVMGSISVLRRHRLGST